MHCCTYDGKAITNSKSADSRRRIKLPKEAATKPKFAVKFELWPLKDKRGSSKAEKICAEKILVEHGFKQFHFNDEDIQPLEFFIEHMSGRLQYYSSEQQKHMIEKKLREECKDPEFKDCIRNPDTCIGAAAEKKKNDSDEISFEEKAIHRGVMQFKDYCEIYVCLMQRTPEHMDDKKDGILVKKELTVASSLTEEEAKRKKKELRCLGEWPPYGRALRGRPLTDFMRARLLNGC